MVQSTSYLQIDIMGSNDSKTEAPANRESANDETLPNKTDSRTVKAARFLKLAKHAIYDPNPPPYIEDNFALARRIRSHPREGIYISSSVYPHLGLMYLEIEEQLPVLAEEKSTKEEQKQAAGEIKKAISSYKMYENTTGSPYVIAVEEFVKEVIETCSDKPKADEKSKE